MRTKSSASSLGSRPRRWAVGAWVGTGLVFAIGLGLAIANLGGRGTVSDRGGDKPDQIAVAAAELSDPRVKEVEASFRCPCGKCGVMELIECQCDMPGGALEVKDAIVKALKGGGSVPGVTEAIAAHYGGRKAPAAQPRS